ncbi:MAG TPA: hypothetical protein VHF69_05220 [Candidatus Synoicihabitans sp.]|nr:hypothetical protein [Candidatus Synoicihabitans sp.]
MLRTRGCWRDWAGEIPRCAVARNLAVTLLALWRSGAQYYPMPRALPAAA